MSSSTTSTPPSAIEPEVYVPEIVEYNTGCELAFDYKGYFIRGCTNDGTGAGFPWCMKRKPVAAGSKNPWAMCNTDAMPKFYGVTKTGRLESCKHYFTAGTAPNTFLIWGCLSIIDEYGELTSPLHCESTTGERLRCIEGEPDVTTNSLDFTDVPVVSASECLDEWRFQGFSFRGCTSAGSPSDALWCMLKPGVPGASTSKLAAPDSSYWGLCDPATVRTGITASYSNGTKTTCEDEFDGSVLPGGKKPFKVAGCVVPVNESGVKMGQYMCKGKGVDYNVMCLQASNGASGYTTEEGVSYPLTVKPSECLERFTVDGYSVQGCSNEGGVEWCYTKSLAKDGSEEYAICDVKSMPTYFGKDINGVVKKCEVMEKVGPVKNGEYFVVFGCSSKLNNDGAVDLPYTCKAEGTLETLTCLNPEDQITQRINMKSSSQVDEQVPSIKDGQDFTSLLIISIVAVVSVLIIVSLIVITLRFWKRNKVSYQATADSDVMEEY
ncbi:hypothetical protein HK096_006099, partial [Nowakowskiella sp. JEL0078]